MDAIEASRSPGSRHKVPSEDLVTSHDRESAPFQSTFQRRASWILGTFLFTFIAARVIVFLILFRRIPDIYLHLGGTHIHHLNCGIFLLAGVGAYLLLGGPRKEGLHWASLLYGVGLALTFDEFGMWLHLGGSYWQRASFDAVVVIGASLGLIVVAPRLSRFRPHDWLTAGALAIALLVFGIMLVDSFRYAQRTMYRMQILEEKQPPR